jgi:hypothetical protein
MDRNNADQEETDMFRHAAQEHFTAAVLNKYTVPA